MPQSINGREPETATQSDQGGSRTLSRDDVFTVLYNRRRRDVITYLRENEGTATVSDLAEYIAAKENRTTVQQLSSSERKCVYVGLYQNHLPMMHDVGVIEYEKDRGTVELRDCMSQLQPFMDDAANSPEERLQAAWPVGLAAVLLLGALDAGMLGAVPNLSWAALGVVGLFVLAVTAEREARRTGVRPQ